jgi:hypothetical protein
MEGNTLLIILFNLTDKMQNSREIIDPENNSYNVADRLMDLVTES